MSATEPTFFPTPADFRAWLECHHETERELIVGFYKKGTGRPSISWPESVDEALCFGWIDGIRRSLSDEAYTIRFTPRKPTSIWSAVNVARVAELTREGRMREAGLAAFARRTPERTGVYAFERNQTAAFEEEQERAFRADEAAWRWFSAQPPGYRAIATHWVISAKRPETRAKRLAELIQDSRTGLRIKGLRRDG